MPLEQVILVLIADLERGDVATAQRDAAAYASQHPDELLQVPWESLSEAGSADQRTAYWCSCVLIALAGRAWTQAVQCADTAVATNGRTGLAHYVRGLALVGQHAAQTLAPVLRQRLLAEAAIEFDEALSCGFQNGAVFLAQCEVHRVREDHRAAAETARCALQGDPLEPTPWRYRIEALLNLGEVALAEMELSELPADLQAVPEIQALRGRTALEAGKFPEAERLLAPLNQTREQRETHGWYAEAVKAEQWWYRPLLYKDLWFARLSPRARNICQAAEFVAIVCASLALLAVATLGFWRHLTHRWLHLPELDTYWPWLVSGLLVCLLLYLVIYSQSASTVLWGMLGSRRVPPQRGFDTGDIHQIIPLAIGVTIVFVLFKVWGY